MLQVTIPAIEQWDEVNEQFIRTKEQKLVLEHSLVSLSKWESKWCKPFLSKQEKSYEETIDYVRCMTITQNVDPNVYKYITQDVLNQINDYIDAPMTALQFNNDGNKTGKNQKVTSEIIYYWMIAFNIPSEYQKWHLNKLMALINVCDRKNRPKKKRSQKEKISQFAALNAERRKQLNSKG